MSQTPSLEEIIEHGINNRLATFFTALPAQIISFDPNSHLADIQILVNNAIENQEGKKIWILPKVYSIPVLLPWGHNKAGKKFGVTFPISAGDQVLYVVSTLPIAQYYGRGSANLDEDPLILNNIAQGFVIPGSQWSGDAPLPVSDDALVLHGDTVKLGSPNASSAIALKSTLDKFMQVLGAVTDPSGACAALHAALVSANWPGNWMATKVKGE